MIVTGYYSDGRSGTVSGNILKGNMQVGDTEVTITYGNLTTTQSVSVERMKDHSSQTRLQSACGAGEATVNLYNGTMMFNHPDIAVGLNSYQIGISHIYNSQFAGVLPKGLQNGVGIGWKLDAEQYCYPYSSSSSSPFFCHSDAAFGFQAGDYVYIDGAGNKHRFVPLPGVTGNYYDTTGVGLILVLRSGTSGYNNYDRIEDANGNKIYFSQNRVYETENYFDPALKYPVRKRYVYQSVANYGLVLSKIYDLRKPNRYLRLTSDVYGTGRLNSIQSVVDSETKKSVNYYYDTTGRMFRITETVGNATRDAAYFAYDAADTNKIVYAADALDLSALKFEYSGDKSTRMRSGVVSKPTVSNNAVSINSFTEKSNYLISYASTLNKTTVTNEKNIIIEYFLNQKGFTTAILERKSGTSNQYMTMTKETGCLLSNSSSGDKINGIGATVCTGSYSVPTDRKNALNDYMIKDINKGIKNYIMSFWIKRKTTTVQDTTATITITHLIDFWGQSYETRTYNVKIDHWHTTRKWERVIGNTWYNCLEMRRLRGVLHIYR